MDFRNEVPKMPIDDKFEKKGHLISCNDKQVNKFNSLMADFLQSIISKIKDRLG